MLMNIVLFITVLFGLHYIKIITISCEGSVLPYPLLLLSAVIIAVVAIFLSVRLWQWYDSIIKIFSKALRVLDLLTWAAVLWFCILGYKVFISSIPACAVYRWLPLYLNIYLWVGTTILGILIVGIVRLFKDGKLL